MRKGRPPRWGALPLKPVGSERLHLLGDRGLAVRGLVLVDDALGRRLVELLRRDAEGGDRLVLVASGHGGADGPDVGLQLALDGLVALGRLLVRGDALDLALDVGHACAPGSQMEWRPLLWGRSLDGWRGGRADTRKPTGSLAVDRGAW